MKKLIISLIVAVSVLSPMLAVPTVAFAQSDPLRDACVGKAFSESSACKNRTVGNPLLGPDGIITKIAQILVIVVGIVSVIVIIVGGFKYIISMGDPSALKSARDTIIYAVVGLVIAVVAQSIVSFVLRKL